MKNKEHRHVIEAIRKLNCSAEFAAPNFRLGSYKDAQNQERPEYLITRDGFTLLAMGFTGAKAMQFKEEYIATFNVMEKELASRAQLPDFTLKDKEQFLMSNDIQQFNFNDATVRVVMKDNEPWWVAKDVCNILELENITEALRGIDDDEKITFRNPEGNPRAGIPHTIIYVNEAGLYSLILRSRKPEAKAFKRWITHEVLPSIRKTGGYGFAQVPQTFAEALRLAADLEEQKQALAAKVEADAPKVLFADAVETSKTDILVGDFAKILKQNGIDTGQQRLFAWFRDGGWLIKQRGESWNMPTQKAMDMGLFRLKERTINNPDGTVRITRTAKITGKGQIFFLNKFLKEMKGE